MIRLGQLPVTLKGGQMEWKEEKDATGPFLCR